MSDQPPAASGPASDPGSEQPERPSRYNRSFGGLLGAMVVTVVFVGGYVGFRALTRDQPEIVEKVDYIAAVGELQSADVQVVYPCSIPEGWRASSTAFKRGEPPRWGIGFVTDDDEFVGIRQEATGVDDLLDTYVDEQPVHGDEVSLPNDLGVETWDTWSDSGGDLAWSAELGPPFEGQTLLIYGSASAAQQEALIAELTAGPVADC
ncbi:MAG TPA: DUF4245 domain-containing protein [Nocardioides sp.]|uniref:DUF4245 domain-containing protein n=1 Tax=uncultured Nocardioides sp. TaxID=198441 RepID=UPI00263696CF|nr:DUF4245 domain-containing protein [uncultured Nocardioides sp.]HRD63960.1 DUF4245 domain-containing protein [Nocardioides sp.]HRI98027.1 DUF4245 domain-containing protein [Nocardioides sp.]HRK47409.1 DUF4245 domain-containing protein [Nocardioides sp.]